MTQLAPQPASANPSRPGSDKAAPAPLETVVLDIEGMMCAGCVSTVEKKLDQCEGVASATVNLVTEVAAVECTPQTDPQSLAEALTAAGYPSKIRSSDSQSPLAAETDWLARKEQAQKDQTRQLAIAAILLVLSTIGHLQHFRWADGFSIPILSTLWFHGTLATLTLIFPARKILADGLQGVRRGAPNMNTLVSLGALSAYATSIAALVFPHLGWECFFDEPVMLLSFILLGRTLEQRARFQAASSLRSLIALQPAEARLIPAPDQADSQTTAGVQIPAAQVQVGEWLRVLPSEKIPADGVIATGQTTVDESMLTGESLPVLKQPGDEVAAGSLNQSGAITLQVSRTGASTTIAQMIHLVETAQTRKAPIQGLADLISGYFTYGVLTCAALTFGFWYFVGFSLWPEVAQSVMSPVHHAAVPMMPVTSALRLLVSLKLAIAVVVVACPCALGLATPTAILVGSGLGAERGLLIRGGDILETTQGLDTLVFDKTGTLTTGQPEVTDCLPVSSAFDADQLLQIAATVESGTRHPLGVAVQQAAAQKDLGLLPADSFQTEAGFGIAATVTVTNSNRAQTDTAAPRRADFLIGNLAWMEKNSCLIDPSVRDRADTLGQAGKTAVLIAQNQQLVGLIGVADTLRPEAAKTIKGLQSLGLSVQILSGDTRAAANAIAQQLGLTPKQVRAEVTPQEKVAAIAALQQAGHLVGLVGDGINDAPALAQADIGIALNSGTEAALETADIVLMGDTLADVIAAIQLSRATFNKIRQNLFWAFAYNLICIPLAAGVFLPAFGLSLNPGFAGGLMAFSSVTVVLNSLLLRSHSVGTA
ncbi:MAG: heavy metal translocating P-type ATPase [Phormidesmis sp.]